MYFSIIIIIFALLLVIVCSTCRKRWAVKKVCSMTATEKCELLNSLIEPLGYCYDPCQDIISSRNDAWQRHAGYTALYDHAASHFNMVFDSLPVYFPYRNRTWLIEFWKGQYGINTGAEIGIYYANEIVSEDALPFAKFDAVDDQDMLPLSFCLIKQNKTLATVSKKTWWLTAFCMGIFSNPHELSQNISIHFPDCEMLYSFLNSLYQTGISKQFVKICGNEICIHLKDSPSRHYSFFARLIRKWAQFTNRICCHIYLLVTHYFSSTIDRLLYLYYLLPFAFRRMLKLRSYYKYKEPKTRCHKSC
ncbi:DUF4474 domain-containing protein [Parablautia muri]|uniref:DUF4474 domain-containing protein n=1 Tax=Parablautia muri TaxID=2320879 RepID=A0A9X5GQZ9_9FIRM|nr:DUF4474 domain-containing protein [Parablautia muri]NBJ91540.1 DUF4474 domain-containing protein [Parablautia muri]